MYFQKQIGGENKCVWFVCIEASGLSHIPYSPTFHYPPPNYKQAYF